MQNVNHPTNNFRLDPPEVENAANVYPLVCTRMVYQDGTPSVVSYWKPSEEELAALKDGAAIKFEIMGYSHAPMSLLVDGVEYEQPKRTVQ